MKIPGAGCQFSSSVLISPGKKPKKPPRPSLPKTAARKPSPEITASADEKLGTKEPSLVPQQPRSGSPACTRSVTVHWNVITQPVCAVAPQTTSSHPEQSQAPVPLPRSKQRKQPTAGENQGPVLVQLDENRDTVSSDPRETASNEYLNELLQAFDLRDERVESSEPADGGTGGEDAAGEMSSNHRNIQARIQAFESQGGPAGATEPAKPEPEPRKLANRPPVAAKPSIALKPQFDHSVDNDSQNVSHLDTPPAPAAKPPPAKKPVGLSIKAELETLHSKGTAANRSHPPKLTRSSCVDDEDPPPVPPAKPAKEPLKPNLNINNHNSTCENQYVDSPSRKQQNSPSTTCNLLQ